MAPVPEQQQQAAEQEQRANHLEDWRHVFFFNRSQLYLLHGDLRLRVDVLLCVPYSCGILVLGDPPYRIGCYRSSSGGCSGTHGLGGCKTRKSINMQAVTKLTVVWAMVTMVIFPQHKPSEIQSRGPRCGDSEWTASHILRRYKNVSRQETGVFI